jgi:diguanylate cyclase (GGDEF)-like protein
MGSPLAVISVSLSGCEESFAMPSQGEITEAQLVSLIDRYRDQVLVAAPVIYKGREGAPPPFTGLSPQSVPMMVTDRVIGTLTVFVDKASPPRPEQNQYLYVFSSFVSSVIDHAYIALQARKQAKTDSLTGISNHRHFHETLDREISRVNRRRGMFTLVLLDIDNFKKVNDTYGHQVGDAVLVDMTREIMTMIRAGDVLARYGGEEFGLILPDTDLGGAEILADRILKTIASHPFSFNQRDIRYTVSIGLAVYRGVEPVEKDRLIAAADRALYDSKEHGKNRLSIGTITL